MGGQPQGGGRQRRPGVCQRAAVLLRPGACHQQGLGLHQLVVVLQQGGQQHWVAGGQEPAVVARCVGWPRHAGVWAWQRPRLLWQCCAWWRQGGRL